MALICCTPARAAIDKREVLVLFSLGSDASSAWQRKLAHGIAGEVAGGEGAPAPEVYDERLDVGRTGEAEAHAAMAPYLRTKYAHVALDAVVAENFQAGRFLASHPELFPGVPRVYVNHGRHGWSPPDGIGLEINFDYKRAIAAIPLALPNVRRIVVVGDATARGQEWIAGVRALASSYDGRIAFDFWDHQRFEQLYQQAAQLGPDTAIYMFPTYADSSGALGQPAVVARNLAARASVPVFTYVDSLMVPGVAGGYVISGERVGHAIGRIVLGKPARLDDVQTYVFDAQVARRFGMQRVADALWLNDEVTLWDRYRWQIICGIALILLQGALIAALMRALGARRRTTLALSLEREQLEDKVGQRTLELQVANNALERQITTDPLTGIGNRRRITARISAELERARRFHHPLALLVIDIDHFTSLNDRYGHATGDRVLVAVAKAMAPDLRGSDSAARIGGEEFAVLLPETGVRLACEAAERLRLLIGSLILSGDQGQSLSVTVSIGVASYDPDGGLETPASLLARAEAAVLRAKASGRNLVEAAEGGP
ncbi:MAG: diguanylate cyclase [Massilia sp.]